MPEEKPKTASQELKSFLATTTPMAIVLMLIMGVIMLKILEALTIIEVSWM